MKRPTLHVVGAAILDTDGLRCLATLRGPDMPLPGKWEFPGGKVEAGETPREALARELLEELGVEVEVGALLGVGYAEQPARRIALEVFVARIVFGEVALREHARWGWFGPEALWELDWAEADVPVLGALVELLKRPT